MNAKGWRKSTLGEIAKMPNGLVDGPFGSNLPASLYTQYGVPVIRGSNLSLGVSRFNNTEFVYVSEETADRLSRSVAVGEDIIFTKKGTLGQTGFIPLNTEYARYLLSSNQMKLSVDTAVAYPLFVYYYVSSKGSRDKIIRDSTVTGVPKTNVTYLKDFPILLPPLAEQQAIASVLGALDDKIELNRKMNKTLEDMAAALFKSWFVDFDPVHAKAEGRKPFGMDDETAALFPDGFSGGLPSGWNTHRLGELCDFITGRSYSSKDLKNDSDTALVSLKSFMRGGGYRPDGLKPYAGPYKEQQVIIPGEIVVARTDVTQQAEVIGRAAFVRQDPSFVKLISSLDVMICRPVNELSKQFLYWTLRSDDYVNHILGYTNGTTVLHLDTAGLNEYNILLPSISVMECFERMSAKYHELVFTNEKESTILAELRDTLLPKLLSGDIRIKQAEDVVGEILL